MQLWLQLLTAVICVFGVDFISYFFTRESRAGFSLHQGYSNGGLLIVYLPGMVADGENSAESLREEIWQKYGDVVTVSYGGDKFDINRISHDLFEWMCWQHYEKIVLIGSSIGGIIAYNICEQLIGGGWDKDYLDLILVDTPSGYSDLRSKYKTLIPLSVLRPGSISNFVAGCFYSDYKLSFVFDQARCIFKNQIVQDSLTGIREYFLKSTLDDIVSEGAVLSWRMTSPQEEMVLAPRSSHVGYEDYASEWEVAFSFVLYDITMRYSANE